MTVIRKILYGLLLSMMMVSCSIIDDMPDSSTEEQVARQVDLFVSVGDRVSEMQKSSSNAPRRAATFSEMEQLVAIPFHTNGADVKASDDPLINLVGANEGNLAKEYEVEKYNTYYNTYYVSGCHLMTGTDRMLVYGKATPTYGKNTPTPEDLKVNGQLSALPTIRKKTADIQFSLTSIRNTSEVHGDAQALATYMTNIANTEGWSTTDDPTLKSYYLQFLRIGSEGAGLMSGAAANITAFVAALQALLKDRTDDLSIAIKTKIDETDISGNNYPRSLGLPDGAAVIRWTKNKTTDKDEFSVRTTTTQLDNINGINRYTYPAELVFFADSPIRTSAEEVAETIYKNNTQTWSDFLDAYYNGPTAVNTNTKAVAVENPIQYGVAKLDLTLTGMSPTLQDAKEITVTNADMAHLPLTGVIIGGQHTVRFNMKPQEPQTDVDGRFIYETNIIDGNKTSTLVLQSYDNEKVPVILEFENNTGNAFTGKDGTVYPGTRFYLIGMVDPADKKEEGKDYTNRVFTQDHTTTMSMRVTSLAKAYTCMPDLLAPRLEIGVQVVTKWIQATTTKVEL